MSDKKRKIGKRISRHQWNRTMQKLCTLLSFAVYQDDDKEAERILEKIEPDGHRMASFARYERRGPRALLNWRPQ